MALCKRETPAGLLIYRYYYYYYYYSASNCGVATGRWPEGSRSPALSPWGGCPAPAGFWHVSGGSRWLLRGARCAWPFHPSHPRVPPKPTRIWISAVTPSGPTGTVPRRPRLTARHPACRVRRAGPAAAQPQQPDRPLHLQAAPGRGLRAAAGPGPLRRPGKIPRVRGAAAARARVRHAVQRARRHPPEPRGLSGAPRSPGAVRCARPAAWGAARRGGPARGARPGLGGADCEPRGGRGRRPRPPLPRSLVKPRRAPGRTFPAVPG